MDKYDPGAVGSAQRDLYFAVWAVDKTAKPFLGRGDSRLAELAIDRGAEVDHTAAGSHGQTALFQAVVAACNQDLIKMLVTQRQFMCKCGPSAMERRESSRIWLTHR